jgi:hypothetical protein
MSHVGHSMKTTTLRPAPRSRSVARSLVAKKKRSQSVGQSWTPPDFVKRLNEDFDGKIQSFSYVDYLER